MSLTLSTQLKSEQVSEDYPSPRGSSASSSFAYVPQRRDLLASFVVNSSPTIRELYELQIELDYQCLQLAADDDLGPTRYPTSDVNLIVGVVVKISGPLSLARFPGTFLLQEIQLRALVSCLALLHYHAVEALYPAQRDRLSTNISNLFQQIAFQLHSKLTLPEAIRYAPNVYLIQLVSQYLSFIRRGDSKLPSVVGPIVKIFFGCVSLTSHQYNHVQQILEGLTELCSLWQTPQKKYKALFGLQEYTRLASSLCRESSDALDPGQMREAAAIIVSALQEKIGELLAIESSPSLPRLGRQWPKWRSIIGLGPPHLDQGYYFLGLLDCAAQLATIGRLEMFRMAFVERVGRLIYESTVPEYRWKAIEVLLSCSDTRTEESRDLRTRIEAASAPALRERILEEESVIRELLENDEATGWRLYVSQPLTGGARQPLDANVPHHDIIGRLDNPIIAFNELNPTLMASPRRSVTEETWHESELPRSAIKATRPFSVLSHRAGTLGLRTPYDFAGLSGDCEHAVFYNENEVSVFQLADLKAQLTQVKFPRIADIGKDFMKGEPIFNVAMSQSFLIVVTSQCVRTANIIDNYTLEATPHGEWEANGVACYENATQLVVALGQGQGNSLKSSKGQITLFKYEIGSRLKKLSLYSTFKLPTQDRPKRVSLDADGRILTCVTTIQNKVMVWDLDEDCAASKEPLEYAKNHYSVERYETGITSTSLYISPSRRTYILATTSPSSERHRNDGEWSFSLPLPSSSNPTSPRLRPPSHVIHNFEQFKTHRALRAGAISQKHNVFAVMEESGRISVLPLVAAEGGGVRGDNEMRFLDEWKGGTGVCLSFGKDGERLVAVDAKGRGLVVEFERE